MASVKRKDWQWYGNAGHFICGQDCRFHLCTLVGPWLVSTVGEYLPDEGSREIHADMDGITLEGRGSARRADFLKKCGYVEIGAGRTYETMVFSVVPGRFCEAEGCGCGMPEVDDWSERDSNGYNDAGSATRGHYAMCEKWASLPSGTPAAWEWTS